MYTFLEIEVIFKKCYSDLEIKRVRETFALVFQDKGISNQKLFFIRKQSRIRKIEIQKNKTV